MNDEDIDLKTEIEFKTNSKLIEFTTENLSRDIDHLIFLGIIEDLNTKYWNYIENDNIDKNDINIIKDNLEELFIENH